jgi:hypothetical protein
MLAITLYEQPYEMLASLEDLRVENLQFLNEIALPDFDGLLKTLGGQWKSGGMFSGLMKHAPMAIDIQRYMLRVELVKSGILLLSLSVFTDEKDGCFGVVFMVE